MLQEFDRSYQDVAAVLTSMHRKELVIGPILHEELGLVVELAPDINTDNFGTFSRDVERTGSQLDAARAKIAAGFRSAPWARVGLASEGTFGPHPYIPFLAIGRELVLLVDRDNGLDLTGYDETVETNFGHTVAPDLEAAFEFAHSAGFPGHGLIVSGSRDNKPAPDVLLNKDVTNAAQLEAAVLEAVGRCGAAFVETDMRAHRNPTRMTSIERATRDLTRRFRSRCPECDQPGFDVVERIPGLPCAWCGEPTSVIMAEALACQACGHREERSVATKPVADPGRCNSCNP